MSAFIGLIWKEKIMRLIRRKEVEFRTGLARSTIYHHIQQNNFPKPIKMGRTSRWIEDEINFWIEKHIKLNRQAAQITEEK